MTKKKHLQSEVVNLSDIAVYILTEQQCYLLE